MSDYVDFIIGFGNLGAAGIPLVDYKIKFGGGGATELVIIACY